MIDRQVNAKSPRPNRLGTAREAFLLRLAGAERELEKRLGAEDTAAIYEYLTAHFDDAIAVAERMSRSFLSRKSLFRQGTLP